MNLDWIRMALTGSFSIGEYGSFCGKPVVGAAFEPDI